MRLLSSPPFSSRPSLLSPRLVAFLLASGIATAGVACSSSDASSSSSGSSGTTSGGDPIPGVDGDGGAAATWAPVPLPTGVKAGRVSADKRGVWITEAHGSPVAIGVGRIGDDGAYERVFEKSADPVVMPNYSIAALAPVDDKTAILTAEWMTMVVGDGQRSLDSTTSYGTAVFARSSTDLWVGSRVGVLQHFGAGSSSGKAVPLVDNPRIEGVWATSSSVFTASATGIRAIPQPIPSSWNGDAQVVARGDYTAMQGLPDAPVAFAVGKAGAVARYDGKAWVLMNAGVADDLRDVAVAAANDAWVLGSTSLVHYDGAGFTRIAGESGVPSEASSIAAQPDGTLWAVAGGSLYRRAPGKAKGSATSGGVVVSDAGTGVCAYGEPNDDSAAPTAITLPASFDACAPSGDVDQYTFVTPASTFGGFVTVNLDDTDKVELLGSVYGRNASEMWSARSLNGGATSSLLGYAALAPKARYTFLVTGALRTGAAKYHAALTYTPFDDTYEPNDEWEDAKSVASTATVRAIFPTGIPHAFGGEADDVDWYLFPHAAGAFTITLADVASDVQAEVKAYFVATGSSNMGVSLGTATGSSKGAPVTLSGTLTGAGSIRVSVVGKAALAEHPTAPPPGFVEKYSLSVSP